MSDLRESHHIFVGGLLGWGPWGQVLSVKSIFVIIFVKECKVSPKCRSEARI